MSFENDDEGFLKDFDVDDKVLFSILDEMPIVLMVIDEERKIYEINDSGVDYLEVSKEDLVDQRVGRALSCINTIRSKEDCGHTPFCSHCSLKKIVHETFELGENHHHEEVVLPVKRNGNQKELAFLVSTILIEFNDSKRVVVGLEDITELKEAEEALKHLTESIVGATGQNLFDSIVEELCEWFDLDAAFVGEIEDDDETVSSLSMSLDDEKIEEYKYTLPGAPCEQVVETGPCLFNENVLEKFPEDKELKELGAEGYMGIPIIENGKKTGIIWGVSRDKLEDFPTNWDELLEIISSRVSAEIKQQTLKEKLQESIGMFRNLLDLSPNTVLFADAETGEIIDANKEAETMLKMEKSEIIGKNWSELHSSSESDKYLKLFDEETDGKIDGYGYSSPAYLLDAENQEIPVEVNISSLKRGDRKIVQGVFHDIRRRKRYRRRRFFYSLLRQDMKNKLGISSGYLNLLEEDELPKGHKEYLDKINESLNEGLNLVEAAQELDTVDRNGGTKKSIIKTIEEAIRAIKTVIDEEVKIDKEFDELSKKKVIGGYPLRKMLKLLLKTRIRKNNASKIKITLNEKNEEIELNLLDNGERISEEAKEEMNNGTYIGDTSGIGGAIYFAFREVIKSLGGKTEFRDSNIGGAAFNVRLNQP